MYPPRHHICRPKQTPNIPQPVKISGPSRKKDSQIVRLLPSVKMATVTSCHILWWTFWCSVWFLCYCAFRGAWRSWAELPTTGAAVTCSPAAGLQSVPADEPYGTCCQMILSVRCVYTSTQSSSLLHTSEASCLTLYSPA